MSNSDIDLNKLTKAKLIELVESKQSELYEAYETVEFVEQEFVELKEEHESLKLKYQIVVDARKEDAEKVAKAKFNAEESAQKEAKAKFNAEESAQKEANLHQAYRQELVKMQNTITDQNETIVSLFSMMDSTVNTQLNYYNTFKNSFLSVEESKEE